MSTYPNCGFSRTHKVMLDSWITWIKIVNPMLSKPTRCKGKRLFNTSINMLTDLNLQISYRLTWQSNTLEPSGCRSKRGASTLQGTSSALLPKEARRFFSRPTFLPCGHLRLSPTSYCQQQCTTIADKNIIYCNSCFFHTSSQLLINQYFKEHSK